MLLNLTVVQHRQLFAQWRAAPALERVLMLSGLAWFAGGVAFIFSERHRFFMGLALGIALGVMLLMRIAINRRRSDRN